MIFNGTVKTEALFFHLENDSDYVYFIEMERDYDDGVFYVRACCSTDWEWKFFDKMSYYELVKHAIFDVAFDSHNIDEFIAGLDEVFEDTFKEIVVWENERTCNCDGSCNNCTCKE